ncbi:hypothetical protein [Ancylobacter sp. FA202]|uniref:hypothetical protein n=1 Tax=Ancylobacter sp. FA202 TaxID=1111106 RepID=UPI0003807558|nr:hypothetical protein [Ancylobacter sp. FA202]
MSLTLAELMNELPRDPVEAMAEIVERTREAARRGEIDASIPVILLRKFSQKFDVGFAVKSTGSWEEEFGLFARRIDEAMERKKVVDIDLMAESELERWQSEIEEETFGFASLNNSEKEQIVIHIEKIRSFVDESNLSPKKKDKIFDRLTLLYNEILRSRTKTDAFFAFLADLSFTAGEMAERAKPALEEFKEVLRIVMKSRADQEGVKLPKQADLPQLPAPNESED